MHDCIECCYLFTTFFKIKLFFFSIATVFISSLFYFCSYKDSNVKLNDNIVNIIFKCVNVLCYLISFILFLVSFYYFFRLVEAFKLDTTAPSALAFSKQYTLQIFWYKFEVDLFGFVLLLLAYIVGFLSLLTLDTRLRLVNFNFFIYFNYFVLVVFLFVVVNDILLFFFFMSFYWFHRFFLYITLVIQKRLCRQVYILLFELKWALY